MMRSSFDLLRQGVFYNRQIKFRRRTTRDAIILNSAVGARQSSVKFLMLNQ